MDRQQQHYQERKVREAKQKEMAKLAANKENNNVRS